MAYVIAAPCVADYSCWEVCPVNCIGPKPGSAAFASVDQLYIDPKVCIDCGACVDICPVQAIFDASSLPDRWKHYAEVNRDYFTAGGGR